MRTGQGARLAMVGACLLAACVSRSPEADDEAGRAAWVDLTVAPYDIVTALQRERIASAAHVAGSGVAPRVPGPDVVDARARTDQLATGLEREVTQNQRIAAPFRPALDALGRLDELRATTDAPGAAADLPAGDPARALYDRYSDVIGEVLDAADTFTTTIDNPDLRRGAELFAEGVRQIEISTLLVDSLTTTSDDPLDEAAEVAHVSELYGAALSGQATVVTLAGGTEYEDIARQVSHDVDTSGLLDEVREALVTGRIDRDAFIGSTSGRDGWPAFVHELGDALTR